MIAPRFKYEPYNKPPGEISEPRRRTLRDNPWSEVGESTGPIARLRTYVLVAADQLDYCADLLRDPEITPKSKNKDCDFLRNIAEDLRDMAMHPRFAKEIKESPHIAAHITDVINAAMMDATKRIERIRGETVIQKMSITQYFQPPRTAHDDDE